MENNLSPPAECQPSRPDLPGGADISDSRLPALFLLEQYPGVLAEPSTSSNHHPLHPGTS